MFFTFIANPVFLLENPVGKRVRVEALLCVLAAALGIVCVILTSVIITLSSHCKSAASEGPEHERERKLRMVSVLFPVSAVKSEQEGEIENLTAQILLLRTDMTHLEGKTEELSREKDRLNWTVGVILQYDVFSVKVHCPQKGSSISHSSDHHQLQQTLLTAFYVTTTLTFRNQLFLKCREEAQEKLYNSEL